jgi:glutamine amidotransferase
MIAVVDYGMGNVRSICNAIEWHGQESVLTADPHVIDDASHLILPGVGAFGDAMKNVTEMGLQDILQRQVFEKGKPFLGICLGLQLLAQSSEEHGYHKGLGWIDAEVVKFTLHDKKLKIPHMGWNDIAVRKSHPLFHKLQNNEFSFYFVHSFYMNCHNPEDVLATCKYDINFTAAIAKDNIVATQFHPEKSQDNGMQVLGNFLSWHP